MSEIDFESWKDYRIAVRQEIGGSLELDYGKQAGGLKKRYLIIEALSFWRFVCEASKDKGDDIFDWAVRCESLAPFLAHRNAYVRIVAAVESLPTGVWRRFLWQENIDFMSFESFLRRFDLSKDVSALEKLYASIYGGMKGNAKELFSPFDEDVRYQSKAMMSYNLLNLDFGFNAYPKGLGDDTKIVEISPLRFLSRKNHADDFVVNTEDGLYWRLYKFARSNYVFRRKKKVELNTHICPGFWYTILWHLFFWVVSPSCAVATYALPSDALLSGNFRLAFIALGLPIQIGLVLAGLRYLIELPFWGDFGERICVATDYCFGKIVDLFTDRVIKCTKFVFLIFVALCFLSILPDVLIWLAKSSVALFGIPVTLASATFFFLLAGYKLWYRYRHDEPCHLFRFPVLLLIPLGLAAAFLSGSFFNTYADSIGSAFDVLVSGLKVLLAAIGDSAIFLVVPVLLTYSYFGLAKKDEEVLASQCEALNKFLLRFVIILSSLLALSLLIAMGSGAAVDKATTAILAFVIAHALMLMFVVDGINPKIELAKDLKHSIAYNSSYIKVPDFAISRWSLLRNRWLGSLSERDLYEVGIRIANIGDLFALNRSLIHIACNYMVRFASEECLARLEESAEEIRKVKFENEDEVLTFLSCISNGKNFALALAEAQARTEVKKARWVVLNTGVSKLCDVLVIVLFPIRFMWRIVAKTAEYAMTLVRIYKLFNELCPYIVKKRTLKF